MRRIYLLLFTMLTLAACGPKKPKEAELPKIQFDFIRFDRQLAEAKSIKEIDSLLKKILKSRSDIFIVSPTKFPF